MTPLTYTECITRLNKHLVLANKHDFKWLVWDKRRGKQAAAAMGFRVAKVTPLPQSYVIKPHNQWSSRGLTMVLNGKTIHGEYDLTMVEEMIMDVDGSGPSRMFNFFVFGNVPKLVSVYKIQVQQGIAYYTLPDFRLWHIDRHCDLLDWLKRTPARYLDEAVETASVLSTLFPVPVRVDVLIDEQGVVFDEFCLTPGLHAPDRLIPEANSQMGSWFQSACPEEFLTDPAA